MNILTTINWDCVLKYAPLATPVVAASAFLVGLYQYRIAQNWKRAEFVTQLMEKVFLDVNFRKALTLCDWNQTQMQLGEVEELKDVFLTDEMMIQAWKPHPERPGGFNRIEQVLRDQILDAFLTALQKFDHLIEIKVVKAKDLIPFLRYYLEIVGNPNSGRKPKEWVFAVWKYIDFYKLREVQSFFSRCGYDIKPPAQV